MNRDDFQNHRPWSDLEVAQAMSVLMDRMDQAIAELITHGDNKAQTANNLAKHRAHYMLIAKTNHPDLKSDAMRESWMIDQVPETADLMLEADLAETLYKDKTMQVRLLQSQADTLRSMMRSARDNFESWNDDRATERQREREGG